MQKQIPVCTVINSPNWTIAIVLMIQMTSIINIDCKITPYFNIKYNFFFYYFKSTQYTVASKYGLYICKIYLNTKPVQYTNSVHQ